MDHASAPSPFRRLRIRATAPLLPAQLANSANALIRATSEHLLTYVPILGGLPVAFSGIRPAQVGTIAGDSPIIYVPFTATATVFCPKVGARLIGAVSKIGADFIALLVHGVFNASIPREQIPPALLKYDPTRNAWCFRDDSSAPIVTGSVIAFTVERLETVNNVFSVVGSLKSSAGRTHTPSAAKTTVTPIRAPEKHAPVSRPAELSSAKPAKPAFHETKTPKSSKHVTISDQVATSFKVPTPVGKSAAGSTRKRAAEE
jgi:DNA-directed RNA polymerase I subunit RPA43